MSYLFLLFKFLPCGPFIMLVKVLVPFFHSHVPQFKNKHAVFVAAKHSLQMSLQEIVLWHTGNTFDVGLSKIKIKKIIIMEKKKT